MLGYSQKEVAKIALSESANSFNLGQEMEPGRKGSVSQQKRWFQIKSYGRDESGDYQCHQGEDPD